MYRSAKSAKIKCSWKFSRTVFSFIQQSVIFLEWRWSLPKTSCVIQETVSILWQYNLFVSILCWQNTRTLHHKTLLDFNFYSRIQVISGDLIAVIDYLRNAMWFVVLLNYDGGPRTTFKLMTRYFRKVWMVGCPL